MEGLEQLVEQIDKGELADDAQVPVSVVKAIREELKAVKESANAKDDELLLYKTTVRNLQANAGTGTGTGTGQATPAPPQIQAIQQFFAGREDDDVPTVKEIKDFAAAFVHSNESQTEERQALAFIASQKDFNEIINVHLPNVIRAKPYIAKVIANLPTQSAKYAMAYEMGQTDPAYIAKSVTASVNQDAETARKNLGKPKSTASVGASATASSSDLDRIRSAMPGTPEFRALQKEFAARQRA